MMALLAVWRFLRSLPTMLWATFGALALLVCAYAWLTVTIDRAYARGHRETVNAAHFDSALVAHTDSARATATAHTDTVIRTVTVLAHRVDTLVRRVPDSVRVAYPVVDTLVVEATALATVTDSLTVALASERVATTVALAVRDVQVTQARFVSFALTDSLTSVRKRPRWRTVVGVALLATAGGFAWGHR